MAGGRRPMDAKYKFVTAYRRNRIIAIIQLRGISETQRHQKGFAPTWIDNNALSSGVKLIAGARPPTT